MPDVALVAMPFGPLFRPSLGLSLLKPGLTEGGVSVSLHYFTIPFAERIGERLYTGIAMNSRLSMRELVGEWIFAPGLFPQSEAQVDRYVDEILTRRGGYLWERQPLARGFVSGILRAQKRVPRFLDQCADALSREQPAVVGFTSVFQQHVASLALAARVKARWPRTLVVFGGANCEGAMGAETMRQFPWVDVVVSGEGDLVFSEIVRRHLSGESFSDVPGVRTRERLEEEFAAKRFPSTPPVRSLDALPYPDFGDFFDQFARSRFDAEWQPGVFMETSRGCWWGERSHCTFCGLNGGTMTFRSKSAKRALEEMSALASRHPEADIQVVDNILDLDYFKTLLPELAARKLDFGLFYETKSNLKREQIRLLRAAGVRLIQPGIESFSDAILKLMGKGVTALHNIQVLKWCKEYGVTPLWNLIWGFPGEPAAEYRRMATLVPLLAHLSPPISFNGLRLDRFSPNFVDPERRGFVDVAPLPAYEHVFPIRGEPLSNLAYYFQFRYGDGRDPAVYAEPLLRTLRRWQRVAASSDLFSVELGEQLVVCDLRPRAKWPFLLLDPLDRAIVLACDTIAERERVVASVACAAAAGTPGSAVQERLEALLARGLVIQDGNRLLALPVALGEYVPSAAVGKRFSRAAATRGRRRSGRLVIPCRDPSGRPVRGVAPGVRASRAVGGRRRVRGPALRPWQFALSRDGELLFSPSRAARERRALMAKKKAKKKATKKKAAKKKTSKRKTARKKRPGVGIPPT